jgi:hypothetical protein
LFSIGEPNYSLDALLASLKKDEQP